MRRKAGAALWGGWLMQAPGGADRAVNEAGRLAAALALALCAQQLLLFDWPAGGAALYLAALGFYLWRRSPARELAGSRIGLLEVAAMLIVVTGFVGTCLYRLDVYPMLAFDEEAYLVAARIALGQIDPVEIAGALAPKLYRLERFEVQPVPFLLQQLGVWLDLPGLMATRLVSVVAAAATLFLGMLALVRHVGSAHAIGAGVLLACSPLFLSFARTGLYVPFTILHAVLCLIALLRFLERWDWRSGAVLGALLGSCLYFYQLSWFVPVLAVLVLITSAGVDFERLRRLGVIAIVAVAAAVPAALLPSEGFEQLFAQSGNRSTLKWDAPEAKNQLMIVELPEHADRVRFEPYLEALAGRDLVALPMRSDGGKALLMLQGSPDGLSLSLADPIAAQWRVVKRSNQGLLGNLRTTLARVFYARTGLGDDTRLTHALLFNPLVAPLMVLGLAEAVRRRRHPATRALWVWLLFALLLPSAFAGAAPRRVVLVFPALQLVAMLPLMTVWGLLRGSSSLVRALVGAAFGLYLVGVFIVGSHVFFERWQDPLRSPGESRTAPRLELVRLLRSLPSGSPILVAEERPGLERHLGEVQGINLPGEVRVKVVLRPTGASVSRESCLQQLPFRWVAPLAPQGRDPFRALERSFVVQAEERDGHRIFLVERARPGACR